MSAEWSEETPVPANPDVPGAQLKAQREAMGWSVEQIAEQLKLQPRQVVALESGDYEALPPAAVVRGFVRAYAKVVKVDAAPLVAMIPVDVNVTPVDPTLAPRQTKPASFTETRFPTNGKRNAVPVGPVIGLSFVVAAIFAAWHFGLFPGEDVAPAPVPVASAPASAAASVPAVPLISVPGATNSTGTSVQGVDSAASAPAPADGSVAAPAVTPAVSPAAQPAAAAPAAAPAAPAAAPAKPEAPAAKPSTNALVLNVSAESWLEVRKASGGVLFSRLAKPGTTESVDITEPVTLVVGNPAGVSATLRGAAVELPPVKGSTISRVNLK